MVKQFYRDVAQLPQISDHAISSVMQRLSINDEFDTIAALKELYIYVTKYRDQVRSKQSYSHCILFMHVILSLVSIRRFSMR